MSRRFDARKTALQMLYLIDVNPDAGLQLIRDNIQRELSKVELAQFAEQLVSGVRANLSEIDQMIEKVAQNWRIERMAPTDRNVMRIAVFEMHHLDTPAAVAINEAVELAREFGTENSASFVNGIVDRLAPRSQSDNSLDTPASDTDEPAGS